MPVNGRAYSKMLDITWRGDKTLFNLEDNIRISMRIYFDLKRSFYDVENGVDRPEYYISAYNWWERPIWPFAKKNKKLSGKYDDYLKKYLVKKRKVEKILGEKIRIRGLERYE